MSPPGALHLTRFFGRTENRDVYRRETGETKDSARELICEISKEEPNDETVRARADDGARALPFHELLPEAELAEQAIFVKAERKAGEPHPVEHAFEERGHGAPPVRVDDDKVVRPPDVLLNGEKIRLKGLNSTVPLVENRIEREVGDVHPTNLVPARTRARFVRVSEHPRERAPIGMSEED